MTWRRRACRGEDLLSLVVELRAVIAAQEKRIAALERQLGRNSGNSSMPPSSDDLPGQTAPARRAGKGGRRGKRPGAPGSGLAWRDVPDEVVAHYPAGVCGCGADLA